MIIQEDSELHSLQEWSTIFLNIRSYFPYHASEKACQSSQQGLYLTVSTSESTDPEHSFSKNQIMAHHKRLLARHRCMRCRDVSNWYAHDCCVHVPVLHLRYITQCKNWPYAQLCNWVIGAECITLHFIHIIYQWPPGSPCSTFWATIAWHGATAITISFITPDLTGL
jgi:hypothetical protein